MTGRFCFPIAETTKLVSNRPNTLDWFSQVALPARRIPATNGVLRGVVDDEGPHGISK